MGAYDDNIAKWARGVLERNGITSSRQAEARTGLSYGTILNMSNGRRVGADVVIKFASAYREDVPAALRVFGYDDMAILWETGAAPAPIPEDEDNQEIDLSEDEGLVLDYYRGTPPQLKPAALNALKAIMETHARYETTHGRKAE